VSRRLFIEQPAPARLRAWCWALLLAPFAIILAAEAASRLLSSAPSGPGDFVPTPEVMLLGVIGAALYASMFTFLLSRLRGYLTEDFFRRRRGRSTGRESPWLMGGVLFALVAILTPQVLCGAINRAIGQVTFESWSVLGKEHNQVSRGCEFRVVVASRTTGDSTRVCVSRERWERLQVDDSLTIMAIFSGLGSQIGAAPDSSQKDGQR
jgi:hypothetical protein